MDSTIQLTADMAQTPYHKIRDIWSCHESSMLALDTQYTICGSCVTLRKGGAGKILFIELLDGSTIRTLQCVATKDIANLVDHCTRGATVELTGKIVFSPAGGQPIELSVDGFKCLGKIKDPKTYFLGERGFISRDVLRARPHQRHHTQLFTAIQIIKQESYYAFHEAMGLLKIGEIQPTLITSNECESGAYPFTVTTVVDQLKDDVKSIDWSKDFFGKQTYLTVSSQLHLEATVLGTKRDSYCMTTAFRAEPSKSPMHLAEFLMPEWEIIGGGLTRNMAVAQFTLKHMFSRVLRLCKPELEFLEIYRQTEDKHTYELESSLTKDVTSKGQLKKAYDERQKLPSVIDRITKYVDEQFVVTTHEECVRIMLKDLAEHVIEFDVVPGYSDDLTRQHEYYITSVIYKGLPTFVRYFPKQIKAFYMPVIKEDTLASKLGVEHVDGYDLLFPYCGEVVGGSQRIDKEDELVSRMKELSMKVEDLDWYVDLRNDASLPHGGAGLGFGRAMIVMTGIHNIKDMQEFPRAYGLACHA
jgi:asparaginyl-tRNA synthetase